MNYTFLDFLSSDTSLSLNWHHVIQAKWINRWLNNEFKNLMILTPPRSSKTTIVSKKLPLYLDDRFPVNNIIISTYSENIAQYLKRTFEENHIYPNNNVRFIGAGNQLSGCVTDYIIMDDILPYYNADCNKLWQWYCSSLVTRGNFGFKQLLITNRLPEDDLPGRIMELDSFKDDWVVLKFPLVAEQDSIYRKKGEVLWNGQYDVEQIKSNVSNVLFNAIYQQNPIKRINEY